ncbi:hypothetical protein H072_11541 [Dactylellina haptotyla CBS 200.50]|uniref:Uncharacterized protein n=1 Tax=Dactylellina haptotyla (strain CBS 200.50) TaxID=1284197 RepID=S8B853_DACHA|nr:hypothetical protein H072_11541 [Dactylellina haptotyla CBS 200.50]
MLSATKLNQLKLQHLHNASQSLFPSSPAISAHLSAKMTHLAAVSSTHLSESTWRKSCVCCGYTLVPGWTASVRVRGIGESVGLPGKRMKQSQEGEKKEEEEEGIKTVTRIGVDVSAAAAAVPPSTDVKVQKETLRRIRKRGKRTRGKKQGREKTEVEGEGGSGQLISQASDSRAYGGASIPPDKKRTKTTTAATEKEPRIIYACKICNHKTIHSVPIKPMPTISDKVEEEVAVVSEKTMSAGQQQQQKRQQLVGVSKVTHNPSSAPTAIAAVEHAAAPVVSAGNATSKKRAKSRKNTLSEMLAKEAANRSAANTMSGFGLDLMDFMKTS